MPQQFRFLPLHPVGKYFCSLQGYGCISHGSHPCLDREQSIQNHRKGKIHAQNLHGENISFFFFFFYVQNKRFFCSFLCFSTHTPSRKLNAMQMKRVQLESPPGQQRCRSLTSTSKEVPVGKKRTRNRRIAGKIPTLGPLPDGKEARPKFTFPATSCPESHVPVAPQEPPPGFALQEDPWGAGRRPGEGGFPGGGCPGEVGAFASPVLWDGMG